MTRNRQPSPLEPILLAHMEAVRIQLLRLHKVLLDDERKSYEFLNGPMGPPGKVLSLVMTDPFFDWLHAISRLIVKFDELAEAPDATEEQGLGLISRARDLVLAKDLESEFSLKYKAALQRNPAAVLAHSEVLKAFRDD
jgi:hypothetical protein